METKGLEIIPPEGYCVDIENSTLEHIIFKKKELTYKDIISKLYKNKEVYSIGAEGNIGNPFFIYTNGINSISKKQLEKLLAINKLMNVKKYLCPNFKPKLNEEAYTIFLNVENKNIKVGYLLCSNCLDIFFDTEEHAQQAIDILGEDTIRLALSTDW